MSSSYRILIINYNIIGKQKMTAMEIDHILATIVPLRLCSRVWRGKEEEAND
jgi:hypothetical protein